MLIIPLGRPEDGVPLATLLVMAICVAIYLLLSVAADPDAMIAQLAYHPAHPTLISMFSSAFTHAELFHLLGNLLFFLCFSKTVEAQVSLRRYLAMFGFFAVFTHLVYSLSSRDGLPSIGLSGVVWGYMGVFLCLHFRTKINCFVWYLWLFKKLQVPASGFIVAYLALDVVAWRGSEHDEINHVAHLAGFVSGVAFHFLSHRKKTAPPRPAPTPVSAAEHIYQQRDRERWRR